MTDIWWYDEEEEEISAQVTLLDNSLTLVYLKKAKTRGKHVKVVDKFIFVSLWRMGAMEILLHVLLTSALYQG
jgi:hypothetical protein